MLTPQTLKELNNAAHILARYLKNQDKLELLGMCPYSDEDLATYMEQRV